MRCPKCGYISFDHLSECEKCSTDLTAARQKLGLPDFKPAMPFFLDPLLKPAEEEPPPADAAFEPAAMEQGFELGAEENSDISSLEPLVEPAIGAQESRQAWLGEASAKAGERPDDAPVMGTDADQMDDDIPVIEFSDDDLEPYLDVKTSPVEDQRRTSPPAGDSKAAEASEQEMVIELTDDDLEGLLLELEDGSEEESEAEDQTSKR